MQKQVARWSAPVVEGIPCIKVHACLYSKWKWTSQKYSNGITHASSYFFIVLLSHHVLEGGRYRNKREKERKKKGEMIGWINKKKGGKDIKGLKRVMNEDTKEIIP